jgi:hypothetical protein
MTEYIFDVAIVHILDYVLPDIVFQMIYDLIVETSVFHVQSYL